MNEKERTDLAITLTRALLAKALDDPDAIVELANSKITPTLVEDKVHSILRYLERTRPEKPEEAKD